MAQADELQQMSGNAGIDSGGDPGDQAFIMSRKVSRLAGSPTMIVDRDSQMLQRQSPRTSCRTRPRREALKAFHYSNYAMCARS
jgi:hypothetical protein